MISPSQITNPAFAGHETFTLRYGWLTKGVQKALESPDLFGRDDALVVLGVGKNMVRAIRHWGIATAMLEEKRTTPKGPTAIVPTALGKLLLSPSGLDPYIEDPGTLWIVHWYLASRPQAPTTWYWAFNEFQELEFTREKMRAALKQFIDRAGWKRVADNSIVRDVDCFIRTYAMIHDAVEVLEETLDCPLAELGLLHETGDAKAYAFHRGEHPTLPREVFTWALLEFWATAAPDKKTLLFDQIAYQPGSPGRIFKLSEDALVDYLDALDTLTEGAIGFGVTAGLKQLYKRHEFEHVGAVKLLRSYYGGHKH